MKKNLVKSTTFTNAMAVSAFAGNVTSGALLGVGRTVGGLGRYLQMTKDAMIPELQEEVERIDPLTGIYKKPPIVDEAVTDAFLGKVFEGVQDVGEEIKEAGGSSTPS